MIRKVTRKIACSTVLLAMTTVASSCKEQLKEIKWDDISYGETKPYDIAISKKSDVVWVALQENKDFKIARLDATANNSTDRWVKDETMPKSFYWDLAVDDKGNPAYIDVDKVIHWKRNGMTWTTLSGKADKIAFGPQGELFKTSWPNYVVHKFNAIQSTWSEPYGTMFTLSLEIDTEGQPWAVNDEGVHKWQADQKKWIGLGLKKEVVRSVAAGPKGYMYALANPFKDGERTIYRLEGDKTWTPLDGKTAKQITVDKDGMLLALTRKGSRKTIQRQKAFGDYRLCLEGSGSKTTSVLVIVAIITVVLVVAIIVIIFCKKSKKGEGSQTKTPTENKPADVTSVVDNEANIQVEETAGASAGTAQKLKEEVASPEKETPAPEKFSIGEAQI